MKPYRLILCMMVLLFLQHIVKAQTTISYQLPLKGINGQLAKDSVVTVTDSLYLDGSHSAKRASYSSIGRVIFRLDPTANRVLPATFVATVQVKIDFTTPSGNSTVTRDLTLRYRSDSTYTSSISYQVLNATSMVVTIMDTQSNESTSLWNGLEVINQIEASPVYQFDCSADILSSISLESLSLTTDQDEIVANWPLVIGADVYDVEWTYIDSSAMTTGYFGSVSTPIVERIFDNNSSRVTVTGNSYGIPLLYDGRGHLFVRARPVQLLPDGSRKEANWGSASAHFEFAGHENDLNWQAITSYAEEGKRKTVLDYFDGSLRSRQTVTKDNETLNTIVAEKIYDYQGRPVIQVLPAPTLNTIIGYSQSFNQGVNSAGYDADNFDALGMVAECERTADSMVTASGASRYYSPQNPLRDQGMHRFIPDAKGYPFTQVEYTPDQTGRINAQSGVGKDFQLKSGHETRYYYGSAGQEELNALFGTEVGLASHYFKNMVRDANGQYSVSYVDMTGKTIATALSGTLPAATHLDTLSSSSKRVLTEKLADPSSNTTKDLAMEAQKGLLVSMEGNYTFQYLLNPETLSLQNCSNSNVCYDCLYDLEISIKGECADPMDGIFAFDTLVRNFTLGSYDTACNTANAGFNLTFSKVLKPGSYQVSKKLLVSRQAMNYYRDTVYRRNNTCSNMEELVAQEMAALSNQADCQATCQSCTDSLGSFENFWAKYRAGAGVTTAEDSTLLRPYADSAYQQSLRVCTELCRGTAEHEDIRKNMLLDMTPSSGQYANLDSPIDSRNIFYSHFGNPNPANDTVPLYTRISGYRDPAGNPALVYDERAGQLVPPQQLSSEAFAGKFQFSWAGALLPYHPEYCKLLEYEKLAASHRWDRRVMEVDTYAEALSKGYLNPTGLTGSDYTRFNGTTGMIDRDSLSIVLGGTFKSRLEDSLIHYRKYGSPLVSLNLWSLSTVMAKCQGVTNTSSCYLGYESVTTAFPVSGTCEADLNQAWWSFRQLYLQIKRNIIISQLAASCSVPTNELRSRGYVLQFSNAVDQFAGSGITIPQNPQQANALYNAQKDSLTGYFNDNCNAYASLWMEQLKGCNYTQADFDVLLPRLVGVCRAGTDINHPFGANTVKPGTVTTYRSFEEVLRGYNQERGYAETENCHPFLITNPGPYDAPKLLANSIAISRPDSCTCTNITRFYAEYQVNPQGTANYSEYLQLRYQTNIPDSTLSSLLNLCAVNGSTCNSLTTPVVIPPMFQCGAEEVCIDCERFSLLNETFEEIYPGNRPVADTMAVTSSQRLINDRYVQFMNGRLGFNKTLSDYLQFKSVCNIESSGVCANNILLVDSFQQQQFNIQWTQTTAEGQNIIDKNVFFRDGILRLPDSIRAKGGYWYNSVNYNLGNPTCRGERYTSEMRIRYNSDEQPWGDMMYLLDQNHTYLFARYPVNFVIGTTWYDPGVYLVSVSDNQSNSGEYFLNEYTQFSSDPEYFRNWHQVKFVVAQDTISIYGDNILRIKVARNNSSLRTEQHGTLGYRGRFWETDYLKLFNARNEQWWFEDFTNAASAAALRPDAYCSYNEATCQADFAAFFNLNRGTNYSFSQIDSLYRIQCGYSPSVCGPASPFNRYELTAVIDSFKVNASPGISWNYQANGFNLATRADFFDSGYARIDSTHYGNWNGCCGGPVAIFNADQCFYDGYEVSARAKVSDWELMFLVVNSTDTSTAGGFSAQFQSYGHPNGQWYVRCVGLQNGRGEGLIGSPMLDTAWGAISNFHEFKVRVERGLYRLYIDNKLIQTFAKASRDLNKAVGGISGAYLSFGGYRNETDWLKVAANGKTYLLEEFDDPAVPATFQYTDAMCSNLNWQSAFTTYFNNHFDTTLTYSQINAIYTGLYGDTLDIYRQDTARSYPIAYLCGRNTPVFDMAVIDSINNCSDNAYFAYSKGYTIAQNRRDSLNNVFDSLYLAKCLNAYRLENFTVTHEVREYHFTLYYYDQAGNLVKTVPPEGVHPRFATSFSDSVNLARSNGNAYTPAHGLATQYRYNSLNQVVAQSTPDAGTSAFWYDRLGRLVASQNAKQQATAAGEQGRKYSYTTYDVLGRITEVGEITNPDTTSVSQTLTRNNTNWSAWLTAAAAHRNDITQTVYDLAYPGFGLGEQPLVQRHLRNRVSYTSITHGSNPAQFDAASFYSYDIHGNVDTLVQDYGSSTTGVANVMNSNGNRWKKLVYRYDLVSGKVNTVAYNPGGVDQFFHRYQYDAENRLRSVQTSTDGWQWEEDARYQYYLHGPLARTVLGHDQVQGLDYAYTLQGWLKGLNSTTLREGLYDMGGDGRIGEMTQYIARDVAGFNLNYFTGDYAPISATVSPFPGFSGLLPGTQYRPLYNGNISSMAVNIAALDAPQLYNYQYDQLNRITGMDVFTGLNSNNNTWGSLSNTGAYRERIRYDGNGNILAYLRQGMAGKLSMDSLQYEYARNGAGQLTSNRLLRIRDQVGAAEYAEDIDDQGAGNYGYDAIGNLVRDDQAGITGIDWTVYGKIAEIRKVGGHRIRYGYDASGNRISKWVGDSAANRATYTWYVRDAQGNTLSTYSSQGNMATVPVVLTQTDVHLYGSSRIGVMNRGIDAKGSLASVDTFLVQRGWKLFEISNHLGNVLATVTDRKHGHSSDGTSIDYYMADVATVSDYYPGGMLMPGRTFAIEPSVAGGTVSGTTEVNGHMVPVDLSVTSRNSSQPIEYVAANNVEFNSEFESLENDEFTAYIADDSYAGTGNIGGGLSGSGGLYRYGFNGMEMSNEIKGVGNSYTAENWEYDPRIGRRWNTDPVINPGMSPYATMDNNPIVNNDPDGDCATCPKEAKAGAKHSEKDAGGTTPIGGFVYAGKGATLDYTNIGTDENANWVISGFQNKTGDVYSWNNEKKWYTNAKGAEYDQAGWFDIYDWASQGFGKPLSEGAKNALDGKPLKDTREAYNQYLLAGGIFGGPSGFIAKGLTSSVSEWGSDLFAGGHRSGQAFIGAWQFSADLAGTGGVANEGKLTIQNLTFSQYKAAKGGTRTLGQLATTNAAGQPVFQRVSTEFAHIFITQRAQRALNIPNWIVNNPINVWKLNTIQHSLIDSYRFQFLRNGLKSEVKLFGGKYNWFSKFDK